MITIRTNSVDPVVQIRNLSLDRGRYIRYGTGEVDGTKLFGWWLCYPDGRSKYLARNATQAMGWLREQERVDFDLPQHGGAREGSGNSKLNEPVRRLYTLERRQLVWVESVAGERGISCAAVLRELIDTAMAS